MAANGVPSTDPPQSAAPRNRILLEDCIAGMQALPDGCVDLAFADPPFNIGYEYDAYQDDRPADEYLDWSERWTAEVVRVLKPNGTFWLAIGDEYAAELCVHVKRKLGLTLRSWVIWYYTFGVNCKNKYSRSHAHLFYFTKSADDFTFNADDPAIRIPSARQLVYGDKRANPKGRLPDDLWIRPDEFAAARFGLRDGDLPYEGDFVLRPQDVPDGFQPHEDTWYFPRVAGTFKERRGWHGCQMPEQLLGRIVRACSHEGDLVLDPFTGSGTTAAVARKLRRDYLGYELSEEYAARARERLAEIRPGDDLVGTENPQTSAPKTADGRRLDATPAESGKPVKPSKKKPDDRQRQLL